jgi:Tfp pilus assembly protein FimT
MLMRSLETNAGDRRHGASGFSLLEMMIVVALTIVVAVISVMSLMPLLSAQHLTNAYNTTMGAMRQARDNAVSQRTSYSVTFVTSTSPNTNTITVAPTTAFTADQVSVTYQLPTDVAFLAQSGVPSPGPDSFGTGGNAIDFGYTASSNAGGQTVIYFCPDGSAQTASSCAGMGNWDNGVVYLNGPATIVGSSFSGYLLNSRAISLWGGTGRVHGWRLYPLGGGYQWLRQ